MKFWGTATVVKRNKRLFIETMETGAFLYTPPDFLRSHIKSREHLQRLADIFTEKQERCIESIIRFESNLLC